MSSMKMLLAGTAVLAVSALTVSSYALAAEPTAGAAKMPRQEQHAVDNAQPDRVNAQIQELHDKLKITAAQKGKWDEVAEAMRDTAKEVRTKLTDRAEKVKTANMTAVDELRSYQDLQQVQYDGAKRLMSPFEALYGTMSVEQKKNADEVFARPREQAKASGGNGGHKTSAKAQ